MMVSIVANLPLTDSGEIADVTELMIASLEMRPCRSSATLIQSTHGYGYRIR